MGKPYQEIHHQAIVIDTHNDILSHCLDNGISFDEDLRGRTHSDLERWKKGGLNAQIFSVWCIGEKKEPFNYAVQQIDLLDLVCKNNPDKIVKVPNSIDLLKAVKEGKLAAMIGIEGGHMIENDLSKLDYFYDRGVRYMTLTWNNSNDWATSSFDESEIIDLSPKGLTEFGAQVIKRMNQLGMIVDLSHAGEQTFWDAITMSTKPVFASHSNVYSICPVHRNLNDKQIKAIAEQGGVIQVNFHSAFLDPSFMLAKETFLEKYKTEYDKLQDNGLVDYLAETKLFSKYKTEANEMLAPMTFVIKHIEYIIDLVGVDFVGIGSDYDGINAAAKELFDVTTYPLITKALVEKGYNEEALAKILGGNFLRVLKANEN